MEVKDPKYKPEDELWVIEEVKIKNSLLKCIPCKGKGKVLLSDNVKYLCPACDGLKGKTLYKNIFNPIKLKVSDVYMQGTFKNGQFDIIYRYFLSNSNWIEESSELFNSEAECQNYINLKKVIE